MNHGLRDFYLSAKQRVIDAGYGHEIEWQAGVRFQDINESAFLGEAAWVILNSGFRASCGRVGCAFYDFPSATFVVCKAPEIRESALLVFRGAKKIDAMIEVARLVSRVVGERWPHHVNPASAYLRIEEEE